MVSITSSQAASDRLLMHVAHKMWSLYLDLFPYILLIVTHVFHFSVLLHLLNSSSGSPAFLQAAPSFLHQPRPAHPSIRTCPVHPPSLLPSLSSWQWIPPSVSFVTLQSLSSIFILAVAHLTSLPPPLSLTPCLPSGRITSTSLCLSLHLSPHLSVPVS